MNQYMWVFFLRLEIIGIILALMLKVKNMEKKIFFLNNMK